MNTDIYQTHYKVIAPLIMTEGVGDGKTSACVMAQAATIDALRKGLTLDKPTDQMECACPLLRRMAIRLNDANWWKDDMERTEYLRPLIPLLLDSRVSNEVGRKRIYFIADQVVRVLTPMRLAWIAANTKSNEVKASVEQGAKDLEKLTPITDKQTALAAREVCGKLKSSAYAYADASAYAYADASAYAYASASADASAYAYADAYASAYADAYASADASAQKIKYRAAMLQLFRDVAAIKE